MDPASERIRRPTSIAEMEAVLDKIFQEESYNRGLAFQPRASDVIISPYAKCGTTWLQHIAHGIRTRGSMAFTEISEVVPWIESAYDLGLDLEAPQAAVPRVFKSHCSYYDVPKGARYICSFRNPYDALRSFYRFFEGWFFEPGSISLEEIFFWRSPREQMHERGYWHHLRSWWEQREHPDVLLLCYEDMVNDLPRTVEMVAQHMGVPLDDELRAIVVRQSSREFMLANQSHFNERLTRRRSEVVGGLPPNGISNKVTHGTNDHARYALTPAIKTVMDDIWREQIEAHFGFADYEAFCEALRGQQRKPQMGVEER